MEMQAMLEKMKIEKEKTEDLLKEKDEILRKKEEILRKKEEELETRDVEQEKLKVELKKLQKMKEFKPNKIKTFSVYTYNTQILLMVFLAIVSLLLAGFFAYHSKLCLTNTTTNETFKWREYISLKKKLSEAKASAVALKVGIPCELKKPLAESKCFGLCGRSSAHEEPESIAKRNLYDRGSFQNISEIVFPLSSRPSSSSKSKPKSE